MSADVSRPGPASPSLPGPKTSRDQAADHPADYRPTGDSGTERTEELALHGDLVATLVLAAPAPRRTSRAPHRLREVEQQRAARAHRRDALTVAVARRRAARNAS